MLTRAAVAADIAGVASLAEQYWGFESIEGFNRQRIETLLRRLLSEPERGACWVAEADGRLCGYLVAVIMFSLEHGGLMAEIDEVFVSAQKRSLGVGARLIAQAEGDLGSRGLLRLQLQLGTDNHRARAFYERHGFRRRAGYELFDKALQS